VYCVAQYKSIIELFLFSFLVVVSGGVGPRLRYVGMTLADWEVEALFWGGTVGGVGDFLLWLEALRLEVLAIRRQDD